MTHAYFSQVMLLRTSGRLGPAKKADNTYLYTVEDIINVRFNERTPHVTDVFKISPTTIVPSASLATISIAP